MGLSVNADNHENVRGFQASAEDLEVIRDALRGIRYGSAVIAIQDGVIVQIDRTDRRRMRLRKPSETASGIESR
ncbi:MAG TPA: YezD family protein [Pirellulaceae bacterium]|nr:YezD family protein [Pirellulaceae bacterium]